ncbi:MAG: FkbM family methyltransferase [candidate division WOR-3 bacterium]
MILQYLKPGMTFYDVGAHFGYFTLLGSYCVGDKGQVHSFEPTPSAYSILIINAYKKKNVKLNNLALFSKKGEIFINDYGVEYSAFNSIYEARLPKEIIKKLNTSKHKVRSMSIDEYVKATGGKPDFVKIDAESAEYEILIGMEETIKKYHPIITIEVGDFDIVGVPSSKKLIRHLVSRGYTPYEYSCDGIRVHTLRESYTYDNILFLPQK